MKFLLLLLVVLAGVWIWRSQRAAERPPAPRPPPARRPPAEPSAMVACRHCGLHLPASDAIDGPGGPYCSAEHLRLGPARPASRARNAG